MSELEQPMSADSQVDTASMWRRALRWLSAMVLLTLLAGSGYALLLWEPGQLPVRVVTVDGDLRRLSPERLRETVVEHIHGGILSQDLAELKAAVEAMPWVRSASLRRHWPDRLELTVEEQVALARWGEDGLVTADGVVFRPESGDFPGGLVLLAGRDERALEVVTRFQELSPRFAALDLGIEAFSLDARGAWTLRCSAGFTMALGTARFEERIARFTRSYRKLAAAGTPSLVDMRYSNGLAIRWSQARSEGQGLSAEATAKSTKIKSRPSGPSRS